MIAIFLIIYTGLVTLLFKFKLLKPRPFPIAWVIVVGVFLIGGIVVSWSLCSPISSRVVTSQYVVQLVPYVKGQVRKVHAQANQPIKKGDLLLEIEPAPYQFKVHQLEAGLAAAKEKVKQAEAGVSAAQATVQKSNAGINQAQAILNQAKLGVEETDAALAKALAQRKLASTEEQIALDLQKRDAGAISKLKVAEAVQKRIAADAAVKQVEAAVGQAKSVVLQAEAGLAVSKAAVEQAVAGERQAVFALKVTKMDVPAIQANLDDARFDLEQCRMLAPADGYVVNWAVQEGTMLVPMPLAAAGTFVCTGATSIIATFPQNYLANVRAGDDVELVINSNPGKLFFGKVEDVINATGEGQFTPTGSMPYASKIGSHGLLAVKIRLSEDSDVKGLPMGAGGTVAIYTSYGRPLHIISKVTIRMKKWLLYVAPA